jgi:hypothetical protein
MPEDHHQRQDRIPVIVCDEYSQRTLSFFCGSLLAEDDSARDRQHPRRT